jgi:hypothetical protein
MPQCRHLIGVDAGASSAQSKTMPRASQLTQIILKVVVCGVTAVLEFFIGLSGFSIGFEQRKSFTFF